MTSGGYREGSGRSKSGYYKGMYCGSTYELCYAIYNIDNNIGFSRFEKKLENDGVVYFPDFILDDGKTIIEVKGYEKPDKVDRKTKVAEFHGYDVIVLRKDDLKYAFDYVESVYNTKKFYTLYDNYKPKYSFLCDYCGKHFDSDKRQKTKTKFCCRSHAGKYMKRSNSLLDKTDFNYRRKLTKTQALDIYRRDDKSYQGLAEEFNVSKGTIGFIKKKKIYEWIHNEDKFN